MLKNQILPHVILSAVILLIVFYVSRRETERNVKKHYEEVRRQENIRLFGIPEVD